MLLESDFYEDIGKCIATRFVKSMSLLCLEYTKRRVYVFVEQYMSFYDKF